MFHVQSYKKFFKNYFRYVFFRLFLTFFTSIGRCLITLRSHSRSEKIASLAHEVYLCVFTG